MGQVSRHPTPLPALPTDTARLHVAMWKLANLLGLEALDPSKPDHELLETVAAACSAKLAAAFRDGWRAGRVHLNRENDFGEVVDALNPYDGTPL